MNPSMDEDARHFYLGKCRAFSLFGAAPKGLAIMVAGMELL